AVPGQPEWIERIVSKLGTPAQRFTVRKRSWSGVTEYQTSGAPLPQPELPSLLAPTVVPLTTAGEEPMLSTVALPQLSLTWAAAEPASAEMKARPIRLNRIMTIPSCAQRQPRRARRWRRTCSPG